MARSDTVRELFRLVGPNQLEVIQEAQGWPALATVQTPIGPVHVAVHVGPIGVSGRGRDDVERRFQNVVRGGASIPVRSPAGFHALLLGLWTDDPDVAVPRPVVVAMEVTERRSQGTTRQSFFSPLWLLQQAADRGWAEHTSTTGERIVAFWPELLPMFVGLEPNGANVPANEMVGIVGASGALAEIAETPIERVRRQASVLVRSRVFAAKVVNAYDGCCAMCGLDAGLVEGAHIYPASARESPDEVWNGVCLCPNHHKAFDRHLIWIEPAEDRRVLLHPALREQAATNPGADALVRATRPKLGRPRLVTEAPRGEMFVRRYEYFGASYGWATA